MNVRRSACSLVLVGLICLLTPALAQDGPGAFPRPSASAYPAYADHGSVSIGAALLTKRQVYYLLLKDLRDGYVVVDAGVFPAADRVTVTRDQFALIANGSAPIRPLDPASIIAPSRAVISSLPDLHGEVDIGIGFGGSDPYGGGGGRSQRQSVSIGTAGPRSSPRAADDEVAARELGGKALPEGETANPVAGYLYFPTPNRKKKAVYWLEHSLEGNTVRLELGPLKKK